MSETSSNGQTPEPIQMGMQLPYQSGALLGRHRGKLITAVANAILKCQIRLVRTDPNTGQSVELKSQRNRVIISENGGMIFQIDISSAGGGGGTNIPSQGTVDPVWL